MAKLSIEQLNFIKEFKHNYPEAKLSDAEILSIYNEQLNGISLTEDQKDSILAGNIITDNDGLRLEKQSVVLSEKSKEGLIAALKSRINKVKDDTKKAEDNNGLLGKAWSFMKNTPLLDWCTDSTNDIEEARREELDVLEKGDIKTAFEKITGMEYSQDNIVKFMNGEITTKSEQALNGYKEGQDMAVDVIADMVSGIAAVGIYSLAVAAAPFSGGASIAAGAALATVSGGLIKSGVKALDTVGTDKKYTLDNFKHDLVTGGFSGALAPVTAGMGGAVGKTVATKLGVQAIKTTGSKAAAAGVKGALMNPAGYEYIGGNIVKRGLAMGTEMAADGALGGAVDNAFRTAYDGGSVDEILEAGAAGFVGGVIMSPLIGGGIKAAGKAGHKIGEKLHGGEKLADDAVPAPKIAEIEPEEAAPFAQRLEETPDIKDLTNPEIKEVRLENGEFSPNGEFVPDGTFTIAESGNPLSKRKTFKAYPDGNKKLAGNFDELCEQVAEFQGKNKLSKSEIAKIKGLVDNHPDVTITDISEILTDFEHVTNGSWTGKTKEFLTSYNGISQIKDLKTFKANIAEYDKFITKMLMKESYTPASVLSKLRGLRMEYFTESVASIKPEDFKKNLNFFKTLDANLQAGLTRYDYDSLFKTHDSKYFERVKAAAEYNKWVAHNITGRRYQAMLGEEVRYWDELSDEAFTHIQHNIALVKELYGSNWDDGHLLHYILRSKDSLYTDIVARLKTELGDNYDITYFPKLYRLGDDITPAAALIKSLGEDAKSLSSWEFEKFWEQYRRADAAGKADFLARAEIVGKMRHLVTDSRNNFSNDRLAMFMSNNEIKNADKIAEFVKLAEPSFLSKIDFSRYYSSIFDFYTIFSPENLDNMIACAKLHKDLPEDFAEFLHSEQSIIGSSRWSGSNVENYQYMVTPDELASRIETIKKYNGKLAPNLLERIYNGELTAKTPSLDMLSTIDQKLAVNIVNYRRLSDIDTLDNESINKIIQYVNKFEITKDDAQSFVSSFNPSIFKELSADELDVIPFSDMARHSYVIMNDIEIFRQVFNITPKPIRNLLKSDAGARFYCDWSKTYDGSDYSKKLAQLNNFSEEDLKNIGPKVLLKYFDTYFDENFNSKNLEAWKSVSQDTKDKLGEYAYYLLANNEILDTRLLQSRVDNLINNNVYGHIQGRQLSAYLMNTSQDMEECLNAILKDPDFKRENINRIIESFREITRREDNDWEFVRELINNPKVKSDEISGILDALYSPGAVREQQKSFARYLIEHDGVDNTFIPSLLMVVEFTKRRVQYNEVKIQFAKELLENPKVKQAEISAIIGKMAENSFAADRALVLDMINSRGFSYNEISDLLYYLSSSSKSEHTLEKCFILKNLLDRENLNYADIQSIMKTLYSIHDTGTLNNIKPLLNDLFDEQFNPADISLILSNISNDTAESAAQIALVKKLIKLDISPNQISSLKDALGNSTIAPEVMGAKVYNLVNSGVDIELVLNICNNAKAVSIFNQDVIAILSRLKADGADVRGIVDIISDGNIPKDLMTKINALFALSSLTPDDKLVLKRQGIDIEAKIHNLMMSIDTKYPLISTSKQGVIDFLKHIGNSNNADNVIKKADFASFGKKGIELEYSREDFIRKMDALIREGGAGRKQISTEGVEIPELKLSEADVASTQTKIQDLLSRHKTEPAEVILEGEKVQGTRFLGTQGGSNRAYYTQIGDKLYYIKYPSSEKLGQSVEEVIASRLYRSAGIDAPNMKYVYDEEGNIIGMAGEFIPDLSTTPKNPDQFTDGFAADAWLADWDAPKNDNTQYRTSGVVKVDVGGSLRYRARGEMKDFGAVVNELSSLIEQNGRFMSMTKQQLLNSLKHVTDMPEARIQKIIDESPLDDGQLTSILLKRKEYMTIFQKKLEVLEENQFDNILEMVNEARRMTAEEFSDDTNIAERLGYVRTRTGFEGLLNTTGVDNMALTPEQRILADKLIEEIKRFTVGNRISDDVKLDAETKDFLNSILQGVPEFAPIFGKPQHSMQKYSLDVHILKVLQDSVNDPLYNQLGDTDKIVLKFSTLLHDIGKRYLVDGSDTGHAAKSAEYVYSILDRFNFEPEIKDRIISVVSNHHWFKEYCLGNTSKLDIATLCRRPQDFLIYQIMAKADLKNVNDKFYLDKTGASSFAEAEKNFAAKMAEIQPAVDELASKQVVITASRFVEVPQRVTSTGRVLPARGFPVETVKIKDTDTGLKTLNLTKLNEDTDMFNYGFNHIPLKDLRLTVHMVNQSINLDVFKTLARNPMNNSAQSISMISMADKSTYSGLQFGLVLDVDNANVSHAYFSNTSSGTKKGFAHFVEEMFENSKYRTYVKDNFKSYLTEKGVEISDEEYTKIIKYIQSKKYPETQIKNLKVGNRTFTREDILGAFTYSRDQLIEVKKMKTHGEHNEIVALNSKVKGLIAKVNSLDECPEWFLEFAKDNNLPIILIGT